MSANNQNQFTAKTSSIPAPGALLTKAKQIILLVEDDPEVTATIRMLLEDEFLLTSTTSGPEGLKLARRLAPAVVVLDADPPGMKGLEICRRLKRNPETCALPVVFCTGRAFLAEDAKDAGAAAFLVKPDGVIKLADCLRRILSLQTNEHIKK